MTNRATSSAPPPGAGIPLDYHYQLGVILRGTRQLLACAGYDELIGIIRAVTGNLSLSGYVQLTGYEFRQVKKCGAGLPRQACPRLDPLMLAPGKIALQDELILFKWPAVVLALDLSRLEAVTASQIQDTLAMFLDSVQQWLDRHHSLLETETVMCDRLDDFRRSLLSGAEYLQVSRTQLTSRLLADLVTVLPALGLEEDQEDSILDTLRPVIDCMEKSFCHHSAANEDFVVVVNEMVAFMRRNHTPATVTGVDALDLESVELF